MRNTIQLVMLYNQNIGRIIIMKMIKISVGSYEYVTFLLTRKYNIV